MPTPPKEEVEHFTRGLADGGNLVEAGWVGFRGMAITATAGEQQLADMRMAFSLKGLTATDLRRLADAIDPPG